MPKKSTIPEILKAYKAAEQLETDEKLAESLSVSKQVLSHWMNQRHAPTNEWLQAMAIVKRGKWQGDMAIDLLKLRGKDVPCICLEIIGDNGICPKHGVVYPQMVVVS
jgi:hypothetical protein